VVDRPLRAYSGNETRRCDICERDIEIDSLKPGWTVVRVDCKPAWSCPDCSRDANAGR
jgi:hypothetical protein